MTPRQRTIYSPAYELLLSMLREKREAAGIKQEQLAKRLGMDQTTISKYERGQRRLDVIQLRQWCTALKVPFLEFLRDFDARAGRS